MQQRQPRLGDILDDYCPRERRLTNHVVVAMIGDTVKQTRCTTCQSDHAYKHASLPRQRRRSEQSALYSQVLAAVSPKKVAPLPPASDEVDEAEAIDVADAEPGVALAAAPVASSTSRAEDFDALFDAPDDDEANGNTESTGEGPAHRRLIRAQLPRHVGQAATPRQAPDFTIRQPNPGRPKRFGARNVRPGGGGGGVQAQGNRPGGSGNGNSFGRGGGQRPAGRPQQGGGSRPGQRQGGGRNRSK